MSDHETAANQDDWLWGWDPTPGIVSVWADESGKAIVWRRPDGGALLREEARFRPWVLLATLDDLEASGVPYAQAPAAPRGTIAHAVGLAGIRYTELEGPGELRYLVSADRWRTLEQAIARGASTRTGQRITRLQQLDRNQRHILPPDEQYLVATGRNYFRDLSFAQLRRAQFDLETTGLDPATDRIFLIAVRSPEGAVGLLEARGEDDAAEASLLRRFAAAIQRIDPDVLENHNLHGFDLPFLHRRAKILGVSLVLGRLEGVPLQERAAMRGTRTSAAQRPQPQPADGEGDSDGAPSSPAAMSDRRVRFVAPGRECIDTLDAVRRYDFSVRDLPGHGLKAVARHFGLAGPERELIRGDRIHTVYRTDPARVRRYATADVSEVEGLSRLLGGAAFALARIAPRRYERLADAGPATGVIDPMLVRTYLRAGQALPAYAGSDGTVHSGAALHLFTSGVAQRIVKADVASLYPSLMREFQIGPRTDHLGALLLLVDRLVQQRLAAKARGRAAALGSDEQFTQEALSAAMKLVVNSAYGYMAAGEGLTRFADVHAANEVTRRGRETLRLMCRALADRGVTLLEADTDGIYFAVPDTWSESDERRVVDEVAALLPPLVRLEFEGRYAAMLSHEPKNYALLTRDDRLVLKGVAFRSSRAEPFGERFLRDAIARLLMGDVPGVRRVYVDMVTALLRGDMPTADVTSRVQLRKSAASYQDTRASRREFAYEAMLHSGRTTWRVGERVRVYRTPGGGKIIDEIDDELRLDDDPRDYDRAYYVALLRRTFATRLDRAFTPHDFAVVFADPQQLPLFPPGVEHIRPIATRIHEEWAALAEPAR
ncbi:MAG TPA: DNA polymerase domain-containing protein [Gemmatimonas sp.]|uniref:DNA polymerase domain-containing protein n=1 Tax=Gemmatimonas sp. TaxID=1962908 RepID=UPI002EDA1E3E